MSVTVFVVFSIDNKNKNVCTQVAGSGIQAQSDNLINKVLQEEEQLEKVS